MTDRKRPSFSRLKFAFALALITATFEGSSLQSAEKAEKPNVILVLTDDQGYGDLACHGNPHLKTPNLDRLHTESVRFTDFHVSPCCSPTRAQVLTGMYPSRVGVWHTVKGRSMMDSEYTTMADLFRDNGYSTGIFGKWHLGENYPYRPQDRGFDEVVIHGGGGIGNIPDFFGNDYFDDTYLHNGEFEKFEGYCTDVFFDEAIRFMDECRQQKKPFFTYLPLNAPHLPFVVGEEYRRMYQHIEAGLQEFYGMITNIDDNIGKLRKQLDDWKIADNTIFIFMTDNGSSRGSATFNAGMRGGKGTEWDGGHRVPFLIYWADGEIEGGLDIDELTAGIDVLPTLVELCGLKQDPAINYDGESLVPLLESNPWNERVLIVDNQRVTYPQRYRKTAVMTERWRFINGKELYEITEDPAQRKDVAADHPEVLASLKQEYDKWWRDVYGSTKSSYAITIGSEEENPVFLTAHDLHGKCIWNQDQVLSAEPCGGYWEIFVAEDGEYEFSLRRFPREFDHGINAQPRNPAGLRYLQYYNARGLFAYAQTNYRAALQEVTGAQLMIGGQIFDKPMPNRAQASDPDYATAADGLTSAVKFRVPLTKGETRLGASFVSDLDDGDINGVYYIYVEKL